MERLDEKQTRRRHTSVSAHVPMHRKETIRAAAKKVGARSMSSYVADVAFRAALRDLSEGTTSHRKRAT